MLVNLKQFLTLGTFIQGLWTDGLQTHLPTESPSNTPLRGIIDEELSSYMMRVIDDWRVKGLSLAIVRSDREVEYGSWGISSEDEKKVTPATLFGLASCSKAFTATAVGILIDDYTFGRNSTPLPSGLSKLTWTSKLKDILPNEWELQDSIASDNANLHDILSHVTGLPRHDISYSANDTAADIVKRMKYLRPSMEFREGWQYNNLMFMTAAYIVEKYSGISFPDFVQKRIFDKLGMHFSTYSANKAEATGHLSQVWSPNGRRIPYWITDDTLQINPGPGGVISNAIDLTKWIKLWLNRGVDPRTDTTLVTQSSFDAITTATSLVTGKARDDMSVSGYGKGWERYNYQSIEIVTHSGGVPGVSSQVAFLPQKGFGLAILTNTDGVDVTSIMHRVIDHAFNLKKQTPDPKRKPEWVDYYPKPLENGTLASPILSYAGTYGHPGYGNFTLCAEGQNSIDKYCQSVLASFRTIDAAKNAPVEVLPLQGRAVPQLLASWPRLWSSHLRLYHRDGNTFTMSAGQPFLFLEGYGRDKSPFQLTGPPGAEVYIQFSSDSQWGKRINGFGVFERLDDALRPQKAGDTLKDRAYVWFTKN